MRTTRMAVLFAAIALFNGCGKKQSAGNSSTPDSAPTPAGGESSKSDYDRAQGTWVIDKLEAVGLARMPPDEVIKGIEGSIKDKLLTIQTINKDGKKGRTEYVLLSFDATKNPKWVETTEADNQGNPRKSGGGRATTKSGEVTDKPGTSREPIPAIYKFEGDLLIVASATEEGGPRPTEFKPVAPNPTKRTAAERSGVIVLHLKKKG